MDIRILIMALPAAALLGLSGCSVIEFPEDFPNAKSPPSASVGSIPDDRWKDSAPGLTYRYFRTGSDKDKTAKEFFAVRIDPAHYSLEIRQNTGQDSAMTIKRIHEENRSFLTFNGGFFTEDFKPTGLLISDGEKIRDSSPAGLLDGIFAVSASGQPQLLSRNTAIDETSYPFAIQNGPTLLDPGGNIMIKEESGKTSSRTAIGLDGEDNIILLILKPSLLNPGNHITLYGFARALKHDPAFAELKLHSMLNLDGGGSTGLMIGDRYFPELDRVQNVVIVKAKQ